MAFVQLEPSEVESFVQMQLLDLARTLARDEELTLEYDLYSAWLPSASGTAGSRLFLSRFWSGMEQKRQLIGLKSDVYLRTLGTAVHTEPGAIRDYRSRLEEFPLPSFSLQLFLLCEEVRLAYLVMQDRPGTQRILLQRFAMLHSYYTGRAAQHMRQKQEADALFAAIAARLMSAGPIGDTAAVLSEPLQELLSGLRPLLARAEEAWSTWETASICAAAAEAAGERVVTDMTSVYYALKAGSAAPAGPDRSALPAQQQAPEAPRERAKPLPNSGASADRNAAEGAPERLPTWHRETKPASSLLRFELERGTRSHSDGSAARSLEEGDQALATVRAAELRARTNQAVSGDDLAADETRPPRSARAADINRFARAVRVAPRAPAPGEAETYRSIAAAVAPLRRKLSRTILLTMERKRTAPRVDLAFGRIGRKLVRAAYEDMPRLFYKKSRPAPRPDCAFQLLVDCSASMQDKMEETRRGLALIHETLQSLQIPHNITGFWEEAEDVKPDDFPNLFQHVVPFAQSLHTGRGPNLLQLEAQQDNRDGFAIRTVLPQLLSRPEKQKILIVFTDGEPSAEQYHDEGVLDTYEAVHEARRRGIEVIGVFLARREITDGERKTMENIYGRGAVLIPSVEELPQRFSPVLKKLLLNSIL
ncbi:nitric oxide reductase activation protein NorD [Paenibacillus gansuensis]|uniref:VWFA domain-containing protein n=1 Tax=Paenibacillus gansuensis TaxID=306542 RepID=A0ABW5PAA3_9BACL